MSPTLAAPHLGNGREPPAPIGLAALARIAFAGKDLTPVIRQLTARLTAHPDDAAALMDLSMALQLMGDRVNAMARQAQALELQGLYRQPAALASAGGIRLLAFVVPGDFTANTPLEFLLEGTDVTLDRCYVLPGLPAAQPLPDHDVAFVAIGESDDNRAALRQVASLVRSWPRPVLNAPDRIAALSRDGAWALLKSAPGIAMPMTARVDRQTLERIGGGAMPIGAVLEDGGFPIIARPADSQAGHGLAKLDGPAAVAAYLQEGGEREFYVAPFVDYRGRDGLFRKYRIAFIEGRPLACHMAISERWMIHYLNAGMNESAGKRAEEARFMAGFDGDFARRHAAALRAITERVGLDYFGIDCGETPDGTLLLFEVDVAMIVHSMDPPEVYPYKPAPMLEVRRAFRAMLGKACGRPVL